MERHMNEVSELNIAVNRLAADQSAENRFEFSRVLKSYVDGGVWIYMPGQSSGEGFSIKVLEARGKRFAVMFSDQSETGGMDMNEVCLTDINRLLDQVFSDPGLDGIVIDPFTAKLCMEKHFLLRCILHGTYPAGKSGGAEPRNWGDGVPEYSEDDLMTPAEIQNFAIHSVIEHDDSLRKGYTFVSACDWPGAMPSMILEKEGAFSFIYIKGYAAAEEPGLTDAEKEALAKLGEKYNASCYWAPVGFFSAEPDRFAAGLALRGDGFFCRYEGLRKLQ